MYTRKVMVGVAEVVGERADACAGLELDAGEEVAKGPREALLRIADLTDEEYLWEPTPNCWSLHPTADGLVAYDF